MEIFGLNGKVYRKSEEEQANPPPPHESLNLSYKNHDLHYQYDLMEEEEVRTPSLLDSNYQLEHVLIHDSYLEIYDESEVPLCINIFNCELPQLRGDKVLIDFFNANNASGTINNSMFTIHKRQRDEVTEDRIVRFKLDAIDLGEISKNNPQSKFNWLVNGKAQVIADIKLPNLQETEEYTKLASIISRFINDFSITSTVEPDDSSLLKDAISAIYHTFNKPEQTQLSTSPYVLINVKVKLTDLKASVPKYLPTSNSNTPFISLTDLRSLINYINTNPQPISVNTQVIEKITGLYNTNNISSTKIFDFIIGDIYEELNKLVKLDEQRIISEKSSMWSHSIASQLLLLGLGVIV
ncbi:uncharacterized protein SPAPADRAFT_59066 [Spathaspora passalidarum NRRL Y-27907]|uniref:Uncharacterized protein n=1 Tax=Spathaspora passalidarum (strain NRRL Y-27907 / 11-Y1) TaxID=619300 RepID=G3AII4_SPAPN|nr:uncharacterized protein SPAPADRAFT_59066 [Spathaspora passalidarum NRRL Y-27907]EGW33699.1 hypothetical protein SPAPADRAFT_59066 [Spathaspora passalidarum NRRL Y-27907]